MPVTEKPPTILTQLASTQAARLHWSESNELGKGLYDRLVAVLKTHGRFYALKDPQAPDDLTRAVSINAFTPMCHFGEDGNDIGVFLHVQAAPIPNDPDQKLVNGGTIKTFVEDSPLMLNVEDLQTGKSLELLTVTKSGRIDSTTVVKLTTSRIKSFIRLAARLDQQLSHLTEDENQERGREGLARHIGIPILSIIYQKNQ